MPSLARVVDIRKTAITVHDQNSNWTPIMEVVLEIETNGGEHKRVTIKQDFLTWETPKKEDKLNVLIDPKNPEKIMIVNIARD